MARPWLTAPGISGQGATIYPCSLLMLVPVLLKLSGTVQDMEHQANEAHKHWGHSVHLFLTDPAALADIAAVAVHTITMFAVMAAVALVIYDRLGLMILKRTWFNVDLVWAEALVVAGGIALVVDSGLRKVWDASARRASFAARRSG